MWPYYALLSAIFAALVAIFGKIGIKDVDATVATAVRAAVMFLLMLAAVFALKKFPELSGVHGRAAFWIVLSGLAGGLSWLFYFLALKHGPVTGTVALDRLSLVFAVILAVLFLGEKFTALTAAGAILMTVGAVLLAL